MTECLKYHLPTGRSTMDNSLSTRASLVKCIKVVKCKSANHLMWHSIVNSLFYVNSLLTFTLDSKSKNDRQKFNMKPCFRLKCVVAVPTMIYFLTACFPFVQKRWITESNQFSSETLLRNIFIMTCLQRLLKKKKLERKMSANIFSSILFLVTTNVIILNAQWWEKKVKFGCWFMRNYALCKLHFQKSG